jgi:hypothetical protein
MARQRHEIFARKRSRNVGVLLVLLAFVALIYAVTLVKVGEGQSMEGFDHTFRPSLLPKTEE